MTRKDSSQSVIGSTSHFSITVFTECSASIYHQPSTVNCQPTTNQLTIAVFFRC
ncbi:hypothetical protein [Scytonema millei]|uniref:Uncharacterized protein n=1 Tax=Scytonema millei VB511283 TaxID=1245923 RepID=A0A9X5E3W7_9CYAN|nr:hypothetical protein [Scytonema millei]NHC33739.1 hypothetical protein [Scytonema millei VB511283]